MSVAWWWDAPAHGRLRALRAVVVAVVEAEGEAAGAGDRGV